MTNDAAFWLCLISGVGIVVMFFAVVFGGPW
jgi:hypothetical protein